MFSWTYDDFLVSMSQATGSLISRCVIEVRSTLPLIHMETILRSHDHLVDHDWARDGFRRLRASPGCFPPSRCAHVDAFLYAVIGPMLRKLALPLVAIVTFER